MLGHITRILLALLFLYAAALQLNDPDPLYWIAVYLGTALVPIAQSFGRHSKFWTAVLLGGVLAGLVISLPGFLAYLRIDRKSVV